MKSLEIPKVNAKVIFVWMNVEQQRKMSDDALAEVVAKVHPTLIFEEVDGARIFEDWTPPCEAAQPAYVPPEVVLAIEHEIEEMKTQLAEYRAAKKANASDEFAMGYFESMEAVLAEEIAKKEAELQNETVPMWLAKFIFEKIIECDCCTSTLGKIPTVKVLFFGSPKHKTGLMKVMSELKAVVNTEEKMVQLAH